MLFWGGSMFALVITVDQGVRAGVVTERAPSNGLWPEEGASLQGSGQREEQTRLLPELFLGPFSRSLRTALPEGVRSEGAEGDGGD